MSNDKEEFKILKFSGTEPNPNNRASKYPRAWDDLPDEELERELERELDEMYCTPMPISGTVTVRHEVVEPKRVEISYKGYIEFICTDEELAAIYENLSNGIVCGYEMTANEYLILKNSNEELVDVMKWDGEQLIPVKAKGVSSQAWKTCKPLDEVQRCAFDSIQENDITVLYGKAGCGKTHIPLAHILAWLEKGKYSKLYVIYSYEPMRNAKTLGFEKGDHIDKVLMSGSIGNILASKLGGMLAVERMIADGDLEIIPTANIRGVEFSKDSIVLVTEAQNLDVYTMKTIVQRCQEGAKQIYEGDLLEQTDVALANSGMARLIEVFKGHPKFGVVKLHKGYRSELCEVADGM